MVEKYEPKPFKERKSQNLSVLDYVKNQALFWILSIAGQVSAIASVRYEIPYNEDLKKGLSRFLPSAASWQPDDGKRRLFRWTSGILLSAAAFTLWRQTKAQEIGIHEIYKDVKSVEHMHMTDADLNRENEVLKQQIAFEEKRGTALQQALARGQQQDFAGRMAAATPPMMQK